MAASEHVSVPVDYYRLLQVPRVSRPDAIRKAYEQHMRHQPATAYSADTLFARAVLLKAAAESLTDPDLRRSYDAKLAAGHTALRVSQQDLPGALVVLQEIGEYQLVLDLGSRWLDLNGSQPDAGDVAAAVALAYCDRAGERLAVPEAAAGPAGGAGAAAQGQGEGQGQGHGAVLPACDDLDAALARLRRYGMAKQLQAQIVGALRDLAPDYACELAGLPLGPDNAARRAKGVALMRGVLRAAAAATQAAHSGGSAPEAVALLQSEALGEGDDEARSAWGHARRMLQRGRDVLTCSEQVALLPDALAGSGPAPHPDVMYDGALAHIVDGFRNGWPHSVHAAEKLLAALEQRQVAAAALAREQQDLAAAAALRRAHYAGSGGAAASAPGVYRYGEDGGTDGGGGAAAAAGGAGGSGVALERAVCAVLLGDFAAAVELLGLGWQEGGRGAAALPAEEDGGAAAAEAGADEAAQLKAFVLANSPGGAQDLRPGLCALAARWLEGVALVSFRDTAGQPVPPLQQAWFAQPRVAAYLQVRRACRAEQVLAAAHFVCNLLPATAKLASDLLARLYIVFAAVAARAQRIAIVLASAAAAAAAAKKRPGAAVPAAHRRAAAPAGPPSRPPSQRSSPTVSDSEDESPSAAMAPARGSELSAGPSPSRSGGAAGVTGAPSAGPFGHPYGKPVSGGARGERLHGAASAGGGAVGVATAATAAGATLPRALPPQHEEQQAREPIPDLRRRFAASASADAGPSGRAARGIQAGQASHVEAEEDDVHEEGAEDALQGGAAGGAARGPSEADLRAHLAGLEAAMWDSDEPGQGQQRKQLMVRIAGAAALALAFFMLVLRRPAPATPSRMVVAAPAAVSLAAAALPSSALRLRAAHSLG